MNICVIGSARHGKTTVAKLVEKHFYLRFKDSSEACSEIFIYDALKDKYGYNTPLECFEDRVNHRKEWHDLICDYNKDDPARLAKDILKKNHIYCGMRSNREIEECRDRNIFDLVIGVFDDRKPLESKDSFDIDFWSQCDVVIPNCGTKAELEEKVINLFDNLIK